MTAGKAPRSKAPTVWLLAVACLLTIIALLVVRRRYQDAMQGSNPPAVAVGTPETCKALAVEYRERFRDAGGCSVDEDCTIEARGGVWFELDGCSRVRAARGSPSHADESAQRWLDLGCAHDFEICPPPGRVGCRFSHCAELPPAQVPADWKRVDMGRVLSFYVPPDMVDQPASGEDSIVRALATPRCALVADLGEWSNPLKIERHPDADSEEPEWALVAEQDVSAGGVKGRRVAARNVYSSYCRSGGRCPYGWRFQIGLHVAAIPYQGLPTLLLQHPKLTIVVMCDAFADCMIADAIFGSLTYW
jgi:hypothetical protein